MSVQDEIMRNTTPKYRAPEMLETYSNQPINDKADIWALGCILTELIYGIHPFESGEKLAIINIQFNIPKNISLDQNKYGAFLKLISSIFITNVNQRPNSQTIYNIFKDMAQTLSINIFTNIINLQNTNFSILNNNNYISDSNIFKNIAETTQKTLQSFNDENMKKLANNTKDMFFKVKDKAGVFLNNIKKNTTNLTKQSQNIQDNTNVNDYNINTTINSQNISDYNQYKIKNNKKSLTFEFSSRIHFISPKFSSNELVYNLNEINKNKKVLIVSLFDERPSFFQQLKILEISLIGNRIIPLKEFYQAVLFIKSFLITHLNSNVYFLPKMSSLSVISLVSGIILTSNFNKSVLDIFSMVVRRIKIKHIKRPIPPLITSTLRYLDYFKNCIETNNIQPTVHSIHIKYAYLSLWKGHCLNLKPNQKLVLKIYCFELLSFTCTKYNIANNGEVLFFLGATVFGDVRMNLSITEDEKEYQIFNLCVHSSFIPKDTINLEYDGSQLDPCYYEYMDEIFSWNFKLELFPIPSSNEHLLFENNKFDQLKSNNMFWVGKDKEIEDFEKLITKPYLDPTRILITMYHNLMLSKHNLNVSNLISTTSDTNILNELSKLLSPLPEGFIPKPVHINLQDYKESDSVENLDQSLSVPKNQLSKSYTDFLHSNTSPNSKNDFIVQSRSSNTLLDDFFSPSESHISKNNNNLQSNSRIHSKTISNVNEGDLLGSFNISNQSTSLNQNSDIFSTINQVNKPNNDKFSFIFDNNKPINNKNLNNNDNLSPLDNLMKDFNQQSFQNDPFCKINQTFVFNTTSTPNFTQSNFNNTSQTSNRTNSNNQFNFEPSVFNIHKQNPKTYSKPKDKDIFSDLLDSNFSFSQSNKNNNEHTSQTLNDMIQQKKNIQDSDPIKKKVTIWSQGKQKNIRTLLSSLHEILWDDNLKWTPISIYNLKDPNEVKKAYRKACLILHPDKISGNKNEILGSLIFVELNEAWKIFSSSGNKNLL